MSRVKKIGDPILRKKTEPIVDLDELVKSKLIETMIDVMREEGGIGLAANQIGISKSICIIDTSKGLNATEIFINPEVLETHDEIRFEEGCLSVPKVSAFTKRFNKVKVRYQLMDGSTKEEELEGIRAIAIQHEIDHLNGKLYIDQLSRVERNLLLKKYKKILTRG